MRIITTTPALRLLLTRPALLGLRPKLKLRLSLASFFVTIGEAFQLAYVAPYGSIGRRGDLSGANRDGQGSSMRSPEHRY